MTSTQDDEPGIEYDWLLGANRIAIAAEKQDRRWVEVLALHTAIEVELNEYLNANLPNGKAVTGKNPQFTFGHKAAILKACWQGEPETILKIDAVLRSFNELRNSVAHPDKRKTRAEIKNVTRAYRELATDLDNEPSLFEIAQGVCSIMGDGLLPHEMSAMVKSLDRLVNQTMPAALGRIRKD